MNYFLFSYKWNSRELKKIIIAILKSWFADNVKKLNYVQNFCLDDKKIEKSEEKLVLVHADNYNKLIDFLSKNFPQIEKIELK